MESSNVDETAYDLIIFDSVGTAFTGETPRKTGLGGSEFKLVLIAEGLVELGKKVLVLNSVASTTTVNGVIYANFENIKHSKFSCRTLLTMRYSIVPSAEIQFKNLRVLLTDAANPAAFISYLSNLAAYFGDNFGIICLTQFQRSLFPPELPIMVVPNMLPDWVYEEKAAVSKDPHRYIYASAKQKGLEQTIELWKEIKTYPQMEKVELAVCHPGWDNIDETLLKENQIKFLGSLSFQKTVEEIGKSGFLFYVNAFPENFCTTVLIAEAVGTPSHVLFLSHPGGMIELFDSQFFTKDKDIFVRNVLETAGTTPIVKPKQRYPVSEIFPLWMEAIQV